MHGCLFKRTDSFQVIATIRSNLPKIALVETEVRIGLISKIESVFWPVSHFLDSFFFVFVQLVWVSHSVALGLFDSAGRSFLKKRKRSAEYDQNCQNLPLERNFQMLSGRYTLSGVYAWRPCQVGSWAVKMEHQSSLSLNERRRVPL